jgi:S-(hydroxymethyl)glutathione dehydrogenase/alcohol dehydrogenase
MKVRAAVAHRPNAPLAIETLELDGPRAGEVLIEHRASGLCHSDWNILDGSRPHAFPVVLGHEGAGVVLECGAGVTSVRPGDHVIPAAIAECGRCAACLGTKSNLCSEYLQPSAAQRSVLSLDGRPVAAYCGIATFASHSVVPEMKVTKIRADAPLELVCTVGCAVGTGVGAVLWTAKVERGASVVVFGLGGIGVNVVQGARLAGAAQIIGVDTNPAKEAVARRLGVTHFVDSRALSGGDLCARLSELSGGGADYSFECTGNLDLARVALECTRAGWGTSVMIGLPPVGRDFAFLPRALFSGRTVKGSYFGNTKTRSQVPQLVDWAMEGKLDLDALVTHRLPLERINEGFELMARGEAVRTVVVY